MIPPLHWRLYAELFIKTSLNGGVKRNVQLWQSSIAAAIVQNKK